MKTPAISRLLAVVALLFSSLFFTMAPAAAAPVDTDNVPNICQVQASLDDGTKDTGLLPVNRWQEATTVFHSNLDEAFWKDSGEKIQRDGVMTWGMQVGNASWATLTDMTEFAVSFCAVGTVGGAVDQIAGSIGEAFLEYMELIVLALFICVIVLLWRSLRHGRASWRVLGTKLAALLLLVVTTAGAANSTGGGIDGDTTTAYTPGTMSPGWVADKLSTVVGEFSSLPAGMIGYIGDEFDTRFVEDKTRSPLTSCNAYTGALENRYKLAYGKGAASSASAVPRIMSGMWEDTGLATWRNSQFNNTKLDETVWCHMLDWTSGTDIGGPDAERDWMGSVYNTYVVAIGKKEAISPWNVGAPAIRPGANDKDAINRAVMAMTICQTDRATELDKAESWSLNKGFTDKWKGSKVEPKDCADWWSKPGNTQAAFKVPSDANKIDEIISDPSVASYINTVNGNTNKVGLIAVPVYAVSALVTLFIFGGLVIGVILASLALALVPVGLPIVLLAIILMPMANFKRLKKWALSIVGLSIIISAAAMILSLITATTSLLLMLATPMLGGAGSLLSIVFHALAPIAAILLMHLFFTKGLKAPSPFTLSGLTAWGSRIPGVGGAALGGAAAMLDRRAGQMKSMASSRASASASVVAKGFGSNLAGSGINAARRGSVLDQLGGAAGAAAGAGMGAAAGAAGAGAARRGSAAAKKGLGAMSGAGAAGAGLGAAAGAAAAGLGKGAKGAKSAGQFAKTAAGDAALSGVMASKLFGANENGMAAGAVAAGLGKTPSKAEQKQAAKAEVLAAREHFGVSKKDESFAQAMSLKRMPANVKGSIHDTWKSFKDAPLQTTKAMAAAGGVQTAVAGAALVAGGLPALAPVAVAGAGLYAANKYRHRKAEGKAGDASLAQAYRAERQAIAYEKSLEAKEAEKAAVKAAKQASKAGKAVPSSAQPAGGEGSAAPKDWTDMHAGNAPAVEPRPGSAAGQVTEPKTSELPVVAPATTAPDTATPVTETVAAGAVAGAPVGAGTSQDAPLTAEEQQVAVAVTEAIAPAAQAQPVGVGAAQAAATAATAAAVVTAGARAARPATSAAATREPVAQGTTSSLTGGPAPSAGAAAPRRGGLAGGIDQDRGTGTPPKPVLPPDQDRGTGTPPQPTAAAVAPQKAAAPRPAASASKPAVKIDQDRGTGTPPRPTVTPQQTRQPAAAKPVTKPAAPKPAVKIDQDRGTGTPPRPTVAPRTAVAAASKGSGSGAKAPRTGASQARPRPATTAGPRKPRS